MQLIDAITEYIDELEITNTSKETIRSYKNSLNIFSKFIKENTDVKKISISDIKSFHQFSKEGGLKQKTLNAYISALRGMFNYLIDEQIIKKNPAMSIKLERAKDKKIIEVFTNEEVKRLVDWNKRSRKFLDVRDNLIISFLLETGCRNHELRYLKESDIHDGFVYFKVTKNSRPRVVPISKLLEKQMRRYKRIKEEYFKKLKKESIIEDFYILLKSGNRMWKQNIEQVVNRVCKDCNIPEQKAYPHNFRHTHAVMMLKNTGNVGHCNLSITEEYLRGLTKDDVIEMAKGSSILESLR
ncbi:tyrosine-type recombinase/integrase [[Eubacterium] tenue]|nr:tyrosine-type recombinase/integrase [[Eubacterium] tenue]MBC8630768.1 tyrosine-type recombinase/integrase [[Eubacterium] tenue]